MKILQCLALAAMLAGVSVPLHAKELHGSIAFSQESDGGYAWGIAWRFDSSVNATAGAVEQCRREGGTKCTKVGWFRNACGAIAIGEENGYGAGWGHTKRDAEADALAQCRNAGNANCRTEVSRCSAESGEAGGTGQSQDVATALDPAVSLEPKCSDLEQSPPATSGPKFVSIENCWRALTNHSGCYFWQPFGVSGSTYTWTGSCSSGIAEGEGTLSEHMHPEDPSDKRVFEGTFAEGRWHGKVTFTDYHANGLTTSYPSAIYEHGKLMGHVD